MILVLDIIRQSVGYMVRLICYIYLNWQTGDAKKRFAGSEGTESARVKPGGTARFRKSTVHITLVGAQILLLSEIVLLLRTPR